MKKVLQIQKNGRTILDFGQTLKRKEIDDLYKALFGGAVKKDRKQHILFEKVCVLTANVTYLGNPHPVYKKRIQLKKYYPDYYEENKKNGRKTFYVGLYTYKSTHLFVVFEPSTFVNKLSHNSSAHVFSMNLQYAQRAGEFTKTDAFGNVVHVFKRDGFVQFFKNAAKEDAIPTDHDDVMAMLNDYLRGFAKQLPPKWLGINAYREMSARNFNRGARQNRWPGWYFEFLFQNYLEANPTEDIQWNADKTKGGIDLDLVFPKNEWTYGDAKADTMGEDILGNDLRAFDKVIEEHNGVVYYICALYDAEKDSNHGYEVTQHWNNLRDPDKKYTDFEELKKRAGKAMKYSVKVDSISVLKIDRTTYGILKEHPFRQGKNSNGKQREPKLTIKKDMISAMSVFEYKL